MASFLSTVGLFSLYEILLRCIREKSEREREREIERERGRERERALKWKGEFLFKNVSFLVKDAWS